MARDDARLIITEAQAACMPVELDVTLEVPADTRAAVLAAVQALPGARCVPLYTRYFDTADGALAGASIALQSRAEDDSAAERTRSAADHVAPLAAVIGTGLHAEVLLEQFRTETARWVATVPYAGAMIELAFEEGRIVAGDRAMAVSELQCRLQSGRTAAFAEYAGQWMARHRLWITAESRAARGTRLVRGQARAPATESHSMRLTRAMTVEEAARVMLESCLGQVLANAGVVASDGSADEHIHQLRIGLRRLRSVLAVWGGTDGGLRGLPFEAAKVPLRRLFAVLGARRNGVVVLEQFREQLSASGIPDVGWLRIDTPSTDDVMSAVRAPDLQRCLLRLMAHAVAPEPDAAEDADEPQAAVGVLRIALRRLHNAVRRNGVQFDTIDDEGRHRLRKRLKRLRYLSELAAPLFDARRATVCLAALGSAQHALGLYNDVAVGLAAARAARNAGEPHAAEAVRWLKQQQRSSARRCLRTLRAVDDAPRFWKH